MKKIKGVGEGNAKYRRWEVGLPCLLPKGITLSAKTYHLVQEE